MGVDGILSVSYGPMSGSGAGKYLETHVSSKYSARSRYKSVHTALAQAIVVSTVSPHPDTLALDEAQLADSYDTKFADSIMYGAELDEI